MKNLKKQLLIILFASAFLVIISAACSDSGEVPLPPEITQDSAAMEDEIKKLQVETTELDEIQADIDKKEKELNELLEGL